MPLLRKVSLVYGYVLSKKTQDLMKLAVLPTVQRKIRQRLGYEGGDLTVSGSPLVPDLRRFDNKIIELDLKVLCDFAYALNG